MGSEGPLRKITRKEVAEHNTVDSAWTIISNKVYDVTTFLQEHPGGLEILLEQAGEDGTEQFEDVGHSGDARQTRETFLIGEIVESEWRKYMDDNKSWDPKSPEYYNDKRSPLEYIVYPLLFTALIAAIYYMFIA
ncbi:hypothetical protein QR680_016395 [Steinernema hermaphroditum]|uniref:Cytochrome b5 n=1 Tax=Steinernema hermaphroditum TaxID=289476 RepID=A0AA39HB31_9BILA|nr:hypothetical protein QR680_016395 [Steinernema hermaphroditum]